MPTSTTPPCHRRRHSWPPFSTRSLSLRSAAPIHFHLNPKPTTTTPSKKRPATPRPAAPPPPPAAWSSLTDIDDDPFAHFLSPMNEEDDHPWEDGSLAFSAGIIIASADDETDDDDEMEERNKSDNRLKKKLARRWAKYVAKYHPTSANASASAKAADAMVIDEGYMSEDSSAAAVVAETNTPVYVRKQQQQRPGPEPIVSPAYKTVVREPTRGHAQDLVEGRLKKRRKYRHSWRAPDQDLFTVVEEGDGAVESEIEQRYFSV